MPRFAVIKRYLYADHFSPPSRVRIAFHDVGPTGVVQLDHLFVGGVSDHGVDVQVVDDVVGLVPPSFRICFLRIHVRGQDSIVEEMIVVLRLLAGYFDVFQPLHHSSPDPAWNDDTNRIPVVGSEAAAVISLREVVRSSEADIPCSLLLLFDAAVQEDVSQPHTGPHRAGRGAGSPVETFRLLDHVFFFPPISCTDEHHGDADGRELQQLIHGEHSGFVYQSVHLELVRVPIQLGHWSMVPHEVQGHGGDESFLMSQRERRFAVEGMPSREPHQSRVSVDPFVRRVLVSFVHTSLGRGQVLFPPFPSVVFEQLGRFLHRMFRPSVFGHLFVFDPTACTTGWARDELRLTTELRLCTSIRVACLHLSLGGCRCGPPSAHGLLGLVLG
eukprot:scaffold25_cov342-Pavlova_lutheri.AAC.71